MALLVAAGGGLVIQNQLMVAIAGLAFLTGDLGLPLLEGCLATCECEVERTVEAGDHAVFIGRVVSVRTAGGHGAPLLWFRRGYGRLAPPDDEDG